MANLRDGLIRIKNKMRFFNKNQSGGIVVQLLPLFGVLVLLVAGLAGVLGYKMGERQGKKQAAVIINHKGENVTAEEVKAIYLENDLLKNEVSTLIQERDISLNNLNLVRDENQELKVNYNEVNTLNEALSRADPNDSSPAQVLEMSVVSIGGEAYEYNFDVLIVSTTDKHLEPKLTLLNATEFVDIPLTPKEFNSKGIIKIQGRFAMPAGFIPSQLKLMLNIDGQNIVKFYDWRVQ